MQYLEGRDPGDENDSRQELDFAEIFRRSLLKAPGGQIQWWPLYSGREFELKALERVALSATVRTLRLLSADYRRRGECGEDETALIRAADIVEARITSGPAE